MAFSAVSILGVVVAVIAVALHHFWPIIAGLLKLVSILAKTKLHSIAHGKGYYSYADYLESKADQHPDLAQFLMAETGEKRTLKEMDTLANKIAHWAQKKGVKQMNSAALMLLNTVDYVSIWFGLAKIGVSTALLNTNVMGKAFMHSVETALKDSEVKMLIIDVALKETLASEISTLESHGVQVFYWGEKALANEIETMSDARPSKDLRSKVTEKDPLIFIFTSGTTGLPKACKISHSRYLMASWVYPTLCEIKSSDVLYTAMPLYHSAAGMLAAGGAMSASVTLVIRKKFSASNFAKDCKEYNVTSVQYIGELCRYLVNLPPNPLDKQLNIRVAFGNGMRREYWTKFQERYGVKNVVEFYASTEGNVGLFNCFGKVGPLGFIPRFLDFVYPLKLVRTDPEDQTKPLRNAQGKCELCNPHEPGLLIAEISAARRFEGYTDAKATNAKILRSVFRENDAYFNTGDLLTRDEIGYFYWSDRIGDTFRWKGENVSTTEVSEVMSDCHSIEDVVVYGVEVPNTDGKAGMAAVVQRESGLDFAEVQDHCGKHLPPYARPLFIRVKADGKLPTTSTHKYVKHDLIKEAFNPNAVGKDPIFYLNPKSSKYELVTNEIYQQIENSQIRF